VSVRLSRFEIRILISYVLITILVFLGLAALNFGLIVHNLEPVNILLPIVIGTVVGSLLAKNKLLQLRLARSNHTKLIYLSRINHELNTPMNAIVGFANLLKDGDNLTDSQREDVDHILYAGNHTISLITELLDYAKIETGKVSLSPMEVFPVSVMNHSIEMVQSLAKQSGITIEHHLPATQTIAIHADEVRLTEVFINILSNAIKYNKPNGHIKVDYRQGKDKLKIVISDTGIGIAKAQLPYLFEPFNRLGAEKTGIKGTGVGLSITRSLVEMMHGTIICKSESGKGSHFILRFPILRDGAEQNLL